ncbi:cytochrome P450 94B3-like [Vicia villosa]|uniref:cytochrome P450 94B3-like n=1 Tax=Vicia villosa TaxID=3911 RepID=UPI00273C8401|nr:cytochrome P450 94B3-like [Vicia villosa]
MVGAFITFLLSLQPLSFIFFLLFYLTFLNFLPVKKLAGTGPTTYPIIGCLLSFSRNRFRLLDWYTDLLAQSPTNTILVERLGTCRTVITANRHNVEYILKTNFKNFPKGKPFTEILGDFLGKGIFNVDGDLWIKQRKLASHEFSLRSINDFIMHTLKEEVNGKLLPLMDSLCVENKEVDLQELLGRFSFNVICKFTLGSNDDDDGENNRCCLDPSFPFSPLARAFDVAAEISARRGAAPLFLVWRMKKWLRVGSERRLREAVNEVQTRVMEMISNRKKKMNVLGEEFLGGQDLLSRLISSGHDEEVIRDMVISLIMAGRDTTSSALTWFFWLLASHSEIEDRIVKESLDYDYDFDYESLKNMKYLKACLCESMRLYPPVAWDSKHATCDDILPDGTLVKSGDRVTYFPYGMGRMENLWGKDWFEFRPDRWFVEPVEPGENEVKLKEVCPFKFPIFQGGPRVCLGKEMAFVEMKYVVASIVRRFKIRIVSSEKPMFVPLLTAHMAGGLKVLVSERV